MSRRSNAAASLVEGQSKRHNFNRIALVGIRNYAVLGRLLGAAPRTKLMIVARPGLGDGLRDTGLWARIKQLCASYSSRATLIEADPVAGLDQLPEQWRADIVYLEDCEASTLAEVGRAWLSRLQDRGILIGDGGRDLRLRAVLGAVAPSRQHYPDGLWSVAVRRGFAPPSDAGGAGEMEPVAGHGGQQEPEGARESAVESPAAEPKRRGRPPGSRNKPKAEADAGPAVDRSRGRSAAV